MLPAPLKAPPIVDRQAAYPGGRRRIFDDDNPHDLTNT
jgi:hypothetical protein